MSGTNPTDLPSPPRRHPDGSRWPSHCANDGAMRFNPPSYICLDGGRDDGRPPLRVEAWRSSCCCCPRRSGRYACCQPQPIGNRVQVRSVVMSYGMTLVKFRNGRQDDPAGCDHKRACAAWMRAQQLREASNQIGLPADEAGYCPFGELAVLAIKDGEATEFGLERPQATPQCRALLFSLINELRLAMFPDYGGVIYAREDELPDIPQDILKQFSDLVVVGQPGDCI